MGSGETAPTMMKHHRELIARLRKGAKAVVLDTPYGFQENAPELAARAVEYFRQSVGHPIEIAGLTRIKGADTVEVERGLSMIRQADYLFAGPGSPTYALRQWESTPVPDVVRSKLRNGGAVTFASAAALTLGRYCVPVYEVYKVGQDPYWLEGLDVLAEVGLEVAVIPHYDNAEGGHHDTRFCYLGERRLAALEAELPDSAHVIGIDEHTGVVIDVDADTATVIGNGTITVRKRGRSTTHASGTVVPLDALRNPSGGKVMAISTPAVEEPETMASSLVDDIVVAEQKFNDAIARGDSAEAVRAALELEDAIRSWSADTLQSDAMDRAHAALRSMIVRLGEAAVQGLADPRVALEPVMSVLIELRSAVRADKRYDLSDLIRDRLTAIGIEVRDTPDGPVWV
jgi:co-chaperonin GroES (HSP10)